MILSSFRLIRVAAWLVDCLLFFVWVVLCMLVYEKIINKNIYTISELLGFPTTLEKSGAVKNSFVDFWYSYGQYILYVMPIVLYLIVSKIFFGSYLKETSVGKWLLKLDIKNKSDNNCRFLLNFIFFLFLYFAIPYSLFNFSNEIILLIVITYFFDIIFIFINGQIFHNYLFGIKIIRKYSIDLA